MLDWMADIQPFRALRYGPQLDLSKAISPPFDTISPELQKELYERSDYNAVRIELAEDTGDGRYENAKHALHRYIGAGVLRRDAMPGYYLYQQTFDYGGQSFTRNLLFALLRMVPWDDGAVLPHEHTFPKHKADRLELMRSAHINASPVFLFYRDADGRIRDVLERGEGGQIPLAEFNALDGQHHRLIRIDDPASIEEIESAFADETLYIADGHHRYETALNYREEVKSARSEWTGAEPENFALVGLVAVDDPGMLVLPTHRVIDAGDDWNDVRPRLEALFTLESTDGATLEQTLAASKVPAFGLVTSGTGSYVMTVKDGAAVNALLPQDRSAEWRSLDYAVCDQVIIRHGLALSEDDMKDGSKLWFTEDAAKAETQGRAGAARYAVVLNPVSAHRVLELADAGERMPQKSTFFYPKVPTGLVFNLLED